MSSRLISPITFLIVLVLMCQAVWADVITPGLQEQMGSLRSQETISFLVVMSETSDIASLDAQLHEQKVNRRDRHEIVVSLLQETARTTQKDFIVYLDNMKSQGLVKSYAPHWLINAVVVNGSREAILDISHRKDVGRIECDLKVTMVREVYETKRPTEKLSRDITPGLISIGADRVWNEFGIDGTGTLVGNIDTGVDGNHPALAQRWRGNFAPASECWYDAAEMGSPDFPVDAREHGTHTMGTMTGQAPGESIGVAPGALWIAANAIVLSVGEVLDNAILSSLEFMADPDKDPTTIEDVPVVVSNSWGVNESYAGYFDCDSRWWDAIDNCEAAGVLLVWAAGNEGQSFGTMRSPADRATNPYNCFSVGATNTADPPEMAGFSSSGPSGCGGAFAIKPEVSAPGLSIRSSVPGGGYDNMSGTSMATPHVAGIVALMNQANPDLDVTSIKQILMETATDMGAPGEDNNSGYGLVNAYTAVNLALEGSGTVIFTVLDGETGLPQSGARLTVENFNTSKFTDENGQAMFFLAAGEHSCSIEKFGYYDTTKMFTIEVSEELLVTTLLDPLPSFLVSGQVRATNGGLAPGATIAFVGTPLEIVQVDDFGHFETNVPIGFDYQMHAMAPSFNTLDQFVDIQSDLALDFNLSPLSVEDFETGDFSLLSWQLDGSSDWWVDSADGVLGNFSASSGLGNGGFTVTSRMFITVEVLEGDVEFEVKVLTDPAYASLSFYIDDAWQGNWFGDVPWTHVSYPVSAGVHTFKWLYGSQLFTGRTWIDNVVLPFGPTEPAPRIALGSSAIEVALGADDSTTDSLLIRNAGGLDLDFQLSWQDMDWFNTQPSVGAVTAYDSLTVALGFSSQGLSSGTYSGDLIIGSNDPGNLETVVPITMIVTGVSGVGDNVPMPLALSNAPNPFNPMTRLHFSLPQDSRVELVIYDLAGRKVRTLVSGHLAAGPHEILWQGINDNDAGVASGTYLARLRAGGDQRIIKLSLTR